MTVRMGIVHFPSNVAKARYMAEAGAADVWHHEVQRWAAVFNRLPLAERPAAILRFCQYAIEYVRDPKREVLEDSTVTLLRGYGDCDAKARVFVALSLRADLIAGPVLLQAVCGPLLAFRPRAPIRACRAPPTGICAIPVPPA